jgi:DNA-binding NtrC family response regulator
MDRCILLIDDDPDELDIFSEALNETKRPIVCIQVRGASAAIKLLNSLLPDYIFLDVNMPGMNGLKCLEEIKKVKTSKDIPVILYSNFIDKDIVAKAFTIGASVCIQKPKKMYKLAEILDSILSMNTDSKKAVFVRGKNN